MRSDIIKHWIETAHMTKKVGPHSFLTEDFV